MSGVMYHTDRTGYHYFDAEHQRWQGDVERLLPRQTVYFVDHARNE
ncbi:MAG: hypothetical protein ABIF77_14095 [bacterium]